MKKFWLLFLLIFPCQTYANQVWSSEFGIKKLESSQFKNDFFQLVNFYQPQQNPAYCGVATAVMILNSLNYGKIESQKSSEIVKPNGEKIAYELYSQDSFFNNDVEKIKSKSVIAYEKPKEIKIKNGSETKIYNPGLTLAEFAKILNNVYKIKVKKYHFKRLNEKSIDDLRQKLKAIMIDDNKYLVANFDGRVLDHKTNGHFAPVVAYNQNSDEVLILDPALHLNQWFWVSLPKLAEAMNSKDETDYRGYAILSK